MKSVLRNLHLGGWEGGRAVLRHCIQETLQCMSVTCDSHKAGQQLGDICRENTWRGSFHLRNCAPAGPRAIILLASPSSSARGGGAGSFWGLTRRQVMRVGAAHVLGGMMTRRPLCLLPRMEPPRASTMKLTRNLGGEKKTDIGIQYRHPKTRATILS